MERFLDFLRSDEYSRLAPDEKLAYLRRCLRRLHQVQEQQERRRPNAPEQIRSGDNAL